MRTTPSTLARAAAPRRAFTLPEMLVSITLLTMVIGGIVASHLMGSRMYQWTITKLGSSDQSRAAFGKLQSEIRGAKRLEIGDGTASVFIPVPDGSNQEGTAVQIYPTTSPTDYIRYYFVTNGGELRRLQTGVSGTTRVAQYLGTNDIFRAEDYLGTMLTESANNRVISITLQFYQFIYPLTKVGTNSHYDSYRLQARITRRTLE